MSERADAQDRKWLKGRGANLALLGISVLFCLLMLEAVIRYAYPITRLYRYSPHTDYLLKPDQRVRFATAEFETVITTNGRGLRGAEVDLDRRRQVLLLGDSFVFGHGVDDDETMGAHLQRRLDAVFGDEYVVINAGVNGYDTRREYGFLRHHAAGLAPELVILGFVINDPYSNSGEYDFSPLPRGFARHIPLRAVAVLLEYLRRPLDLFRKLGFDVGRPGVDHLDCLKPARCERGWRETLSYFDRIKEVVDSLGARLVIAHLPIVSQLVIGGWADHVEDHATSMLVSYCARTGVRFVDLRDSNLRPEDYHPVDSHWTPAGQRKAADFLFHQLFLDSGLTQKPKALRP